MYHSQNLASEDVMEFSTTNYLNWTITQNYLQHDEAPSFFVTAAKYFISLFKPSLRRIFL